MSSGGLSADGRTVVLTLVARAYPRRKTGFALVRTGPMAIRDTIELDGDWRFDAISPHGCWLYLIEQLERFDLTRGAVRTYHVERDRLLPPRSNSTCPPA
jgi:hypothetical protein